MFVSDLMLDIRARLHLRREKMLSGPVGRQNERTSSPGSQHVSMFLLRRKLVHFLCLSMAGLPAFGQPKTGEPIKTTVCEIVRHPESFDGKLVQVRALVETGLQDLPSGMTDDSCNGELKFYTPGDQQLVRLAKSKEFQKLVKNTKKNPLVEATVTGLFKRFGTTETPDNRLALESVSDILVHSQPRVRH